MAFIMLYIVLVFLFCFYFIHKPDKEILKGECPQSAISYYDIIVIISLKAYTRKH